MTTRRVTQLVANVTIMRCGFLRSLSSHLPKRYVYICIVSLFPAICGLNFNETLIIKY